MSRFMNERKKEHPIILLSRQYPQLLLPIQSGQKDTETYKDTVLRGNIPDLRPEFTMSDEDALSDEVTPAGTVQVLLLSKRVDFEHALRCLAYRCEPVEIPLSLGATSISGLINWKKIHGHMENYERNGGSDLSAEFSRFTADKSNYLDNLILLSSGEYSNVPAEQVGREKADWLNTSVAVRKYHELTHFYCRKRYLDNKDALRDEILADMIGILAGFGYYDTAAARCFLGIEGENYREGGRLQNYVEREELVNAVSRANRLIDLFSDVVEQFKGESVFQLIDFIEINKFGL